jgi:Flp pilus assembly pilin Flp
MKRLLKILLSEDGGQDLIEYTLLMAFVALTSAALFLGAGQSTSQIWSSADNVLTTAADGPSGSPGGPAGGGTGGSGGSGGGGSDGGGGGHDGGGGDGGGGGHH